MSHAPGLGELKRDIDEYVELESALNTLYGMKTPRPLAPATDEELAALDCHLRRAGLPFPPSYRAFLTVCNGFENFNYNLDLLSVQKVMQPVDELLELDFPDFAPFLIGAGNTSKFIAFDVASRDKHDELDVVWVMEDGGQFRYPSFAALLQTLLAESRRTLMIVRAPQEGTPDGPDPSL